MIINNKIEQIFGTAGSTSGYVFIIIGIVLLFYSFTGILVLIIGAFMAFSTTSAIIDFDNKRVKFSNNLFGFIKTGKWIDISPKMKIGIKKSDLSWRSFSRSNRSIDIDDKDFIIYIYSEKTNLNIALKKVNNLEVANKELDYFTKELSMDN